MKKTIFTLAFFALFAVAGNAQNSNNAASQDNNSNKELKKPIVNPDGTLANGAKEAEVKTENTKKEVPPAKDGTRMAITEKGVPAKKKTKTN